jgi:hypothetical protein
MPLPRFRLRTLMVAVAVAAVLLWEFVTLGLKVWKEQREQAPAASHFMRWLDRSILASGPTMMRGGSMSSPGPLGPLESRGRFELGTGAGRVIEVTVLIDDRPGRKTKRVAVSSGDRTVEVPPRDVEAERPTDFRALLPEAFR